MYNRQLRQQISKWVKLDLNASRSSGLVYEGCQFHIPLRQSIHVMRWQSNIYFIVNIEPFRMMVHLLGLQSYSRHKSESLEIEMLSQIAGQWTNNWYKHQYSYDIPHWSFWTRTPYRSHPCSLGQSIPSTATGSGSGLFLPKLVYSDKN